MTLPLSAPMLDLLVLSVIAEEDAYGYQIGRIIKRASATMKDSALYPILKRLQENHFVETYYTITDAGRQYLAELTEEWERYRTVVDDIVKGGNLS